MSTTYEADLVRDLMEELLAEPGLNAEHITLNTSDGAVTISGTVGSYFEKALAEAVAMRMAGVRSVANDLAVNPPLADRRTDPEIADAAAHALNGNVAIPKSVQAVIKDGWLTLHGSVTWRYERLAAERAVRDLAGVRGITNLITVQRQPAGADLKSSIERRFTRSALLDASQLAVEVDDARVILRGIARSAIERSEAERLALSVPGVVEIDNAITIAVAPSEPD